MTFKNHPLRLASLVLLFGLMAGAIVAILSTI